MTRKSNDEQSEKPQNRTENSKSRTKTIHDKKGGSKVVSHRKNTSSSTRGEERQRSGNNDPQVGSH
jgi:hypothetical protein